MFIFIITFVQIAYNLLIACDSSPIGPVVCPSVCSKVTKWEKATLEKAVSCKLVLANLVREVMDEIVELPLWVTSVRYALSYLASLATNVKMSKCHDVKIPCTAALSPSGLVVDSIQELSRTQFFLAALA